MMWSVSRCEVNEMPKLSESGLRQPVLQLFGELCELCVQTGHFGVLGLEKNKKVPRHGTFF